MKKTFFCIIAVFILSASVYAQAENFSVYTFKCDPSLRIGYPDGWTVEEDLDETGSVISASVSRTSNADSEGFIFFLTTYPLDSAIQNSKQFADSAIENLRTEGGLTGLKVDKEYQHSGSEAIHVSELSVTHEDLKFYGMSWSSLLKTEEMAIALFCLFYGPDTTYKNFSPEKMLSGFFAPIFGSEIGTDQTQTRKPPSASSHKAGAEGKIIAVTETQKGERVIASIDASTKNVKYLNTPSPARIMTPAIFQKGSILALPVHAYNRLIISSYPDMSREASFVELPAQQSEVYFDHPTISHNGELVAFRVKGLSIAGTIESRDWYSGSYTGSYTAIASEVSVVAFDIKTKTLKLSYITREMLDMDSKEPLFPAFSPIEDIIAFINYNKLILMQGSTGRKIREIDLGNDIPMDISGLAWVADGSGLGYFTRGEDGEAAQYYITLIDHTRNQKFNIPLPKNLRPASRGSISSPACLDFSPDNKYIVFSAESADLSNKITEWYYRLEKRGEKISTNIYIYDIQQNQFFQMTTDGKSFDPVWKGR